MKLTVEERYFIWLNSFAFLTPAKIKEFKMQFGTYENVFKQASDHNNFFKTKLADDEIKKFFYAASNEFINSMFKNLEDQNVGILTKSNEEFFSVFKEKAPLCDVDILFYKGDINLLKTKSIAIVGTRSPDAYGKRITEEFAKCLAENGLTIVSGLASGVDSIAHQSALNCGGKTIAVLGGGFNNIYPSFNTNLAKEISNKGLLISEYAPQILPNAYHFPVRNRIIAGISDAVLITQAGEKSGSMHTKNYAIDYGKDLFIIPADITRDASKGTNAVIASLPHTYVISPDEILGKLNIIKKTEKSTSLQLSIEEKMILDIVGSEEMHFSEILIKSKMESKTLSSLLTMMKVNGIIKQSPGNFFSK